MMISTPKSRPSEVVLNVATHHFMGFEVGQIENYCKSPLPVKSVRLMPYYKNGP